MASSCTTLHLKKYAFFGALLGFVVVCYVNFIQSLQDFLWAVGQSYDCPSGNEASLKDMGKHLTQIHQEAHCEQNLSEHNITMCMVYGI